jgi:hypothetical protein
MGRKKTKPKIPSINTGGNGKAGKDPITGIGSADNQFYAELSGAKAFSDTIYGKGSEVLKGYESSFSNAFDMPQLSAVYEFGSQAFSMLISKEQVQKSDPTNYWYAATKTVYLGDFKYDGKRFTGGTVKYAGSQTYFFSEISQKIMNATSNPATSGVKDYTATPLVIDSQLQPANLASAKGTNINDFQVIWSQLFSSYFPANWWQNIGSNFIASPSS